MLVVKMISRLKLQLQ